MAVALAALLSAACVRTRTDPVTGKVDVDVESPLKRGEDWKAGIAGGSITGQARAAVLNGQSTVTVNLNGLAPSATHAWRIFEGKCATAGALVGGDALYAPITASADGTAQASARLGVALDEAKDYNVRIYASPTETTTVAACGDLSDSA
ncbi:hypothetical protein PYV61_17215 [Roseisolibacter sp. H3M3-2]|nr:hypothetical protein [Roseisolibacter sp. H3M3-2]